MRGETLDDLAIVWGLKRRYFGLEPDKSLEVRIKDKVLGVIKSKGDKVHIDDIKHSDSTTLLSRHKKLVTTIAKAGRSTTNWDSEISAIELELLERLGEINPVPLPSYSYLYR